MATFIYTFILQPVQVSVVQFISSFICNLLYIHYFLQLLYINASHMNLSRLHIDPYIQEYIVLEILCFQTLRETN